MTTKPAHNECNKCKFRWADLPGMLAKVPECPECGSPYWTWANYEPKQK